MTTNDFVDRSELIMLILRIQTLVALAIILFAASVTVDGLGQDKKPQNDLLNAAYKLAGENRVELESAMNAVSEEHRKGLRFLIENMLERDLKKLDAKFLIENVAYAYKARKEMPWGKSIPEEIFLNDVLPYFNIDETREPWRKEFYQMCVPIVKDCQTAAEAGQRLNEQLFKKVNVRYSTKRKKANQSPGESIEQGLASCTGLSILLVDACRSVGVPARLVGIPRWPNKRGNHTWVEIWDNKWNFTGACEANPKGLNHTWFERDAALAKKDSRMNAIYAVSFKKTDTRFPMVWARGRDVVYAVNVTDHYNGESGKTNSTDKVRLMIRVFDASGSRRLARPIVVLAENDAKTEIGKGYSRDESADTNDIFEVEVRKNTSVSVLVGKSGQQISKTVKVGDKTQKTVDFRMPE